MPAVKKSTTLRQQRAAATRNRMLDSAYDLFCANGFRATTMEDIAKRADLAVQTVYFTFHTKDELLQEVHDRTVLGEDEIPPPQQGWYVAAIAEPDVRRALALIVKGVSSIMARVAPMIPVFHAVSADPAGQVWRRGEDLRRQGYDDLVEALAAKAPLRTGLTRRKASDVLFVILSAEMYRSFVLECGWSRARWTTWTARNLTWELFDLDPVR